MWSSCQGDHTISKDKGIQMSPKRLKNGMKPSVFHLNRLVLGGLNRRLPNPCLVCFQTLVTALCCTNAFKVNSPMLCVIKNVCRQTSTSLNWQLYRKRFRVESPYVFQLTTFRFYFQFCHNVEFFFIFCHFRQGNNMFSNVRKTKG